MKFLHKAIIASVVLASASTTQILATAAIEQRVNKLFDRFVNLQDRAFSWKCFAYKMAKALKGDRRSYEAGEAFEDLIDSESTVKIAWKLMSYQNSLPSSTKRKFENHKSKLLEVLQNRIALNGRARCESHLS